MSPWTNDELNKIGKAEELEIQSMRKDATLRDPVTIWVVRVEAGLYIRAVKGRQGPWFRGTQTRKEGQIQAGGVKKVVTFTDETDEAINRKVDEAFRAKYHRYSADIVNTVLTPEARASTLKLLSQ
jgi:hypothetical protein